MSNIIRVVMADDAAAVRRMVSDTLSKCPGIKVVGAGRNGKEALTIIAKEKPDVILLDVEMPIMDGIDTLKQIRRTDKKTPVMMFSSLTVKGAGATLDALSFGANDYVAKPTGMANAQEAIKYLKSELVPKIKQWGLRAKPKPLTVRPARTAATAKTTTASSPERLAPSKPTSNAPIDLIVVGSSTGGPNTLSEIISNLPQSLPVPVLIVQHMPPVFTQLLAERLDRVSRLNVKEANDGMAANPGDVLIAPGDFHMTVNRSIGNFRVALNQDAQENSCRPAVDVLFRSAAKTCGSNTLGIVLTGMGRDGAEGCKALSKTGATIIAQDEESCVVWGMPRAVAEAGVADKILPLKDMASVITEQANLRRAPRNLAAT